MSTLLIVLGLAGLIGGLILRLTVGDKPATEPGPRHRATRVPSHRAEPTPRTAEGSQEQWFETPLVAVRRTLALHRSLDESVQTPMWRRLISALELALLTAVVGLIAAGAIAAVAVLLGSFLSSAI